MMDEDRSYIYGLQNKQFSKVRFAELFVFMGFIFSRCVMMAKCYMSQPIRMLFIPTESM